MKSCVWGIALYLVVALFPVWPPVWAPAWADASDLSSLVEEALHASPVLTALRHRADAMWALIPQAAALGDPTVGLLLDDLPGDLDVTRTAEVWLTAERAIPFPGKRALRVSEADIAAQMADLAVRMKAVEIRADVTRAWVRLIGIRQEQAINARLLDRRQTEIDLAHLKFAAGGGTQADILNGQMAWTSLLQMQAALDDEALQVTAEINRLRGQSTPLAPPDAIPSPPEVPPLDLLQMQADRTRPQAREAVLKREQGALTRRGAELARRPDFGLQLGRGQMRQGSGLWMAMFSMTIPNFWADTQRARRDEATALASAAEQDAAADRLQVASDLTQALSKLKTNRQLLSVSEKTLRPLAETAVETALLAYRTDRGDFGAVLKGEETLGEIERQIIRTRVALWEAIAQIEQTIGAPL